MNSQIHVHSSINAIELILICHTDTIQFPSRLPSHVNLVSSRLMGHVSLVPSHVSLVPSHLILDPRKLMIHVSLVLVFEQLLSRDHIFPRRSREAAQT